MYGCDIVWPAAIRSAASSYAWSRASAGRKASRGTRSMAASTRSSEMSRVRSCSATIVRRASAKSGDTSGRRGLDPEAARDGGSDIDDARRRRAGADGEHRHLRVAREQRAVAAAADVEAAADVGELVALGGADEHLARAGVGERLPDALEAVRVGKERSVAGRPPAVVAVGPEAKLLPASAD